jgi:hypothetical protein
MEMHMRSTNELVKELRKAPEHWLDAVIVVAFEDRFEFVREDNSFPITRLNSLEKRGGLPIGLAGMKPTDNNDAFCVKVFKEFEREAWAHQYMDTLRRIVRRNSGRLPRP